MKKIGVLAAGAVLIAVFLARMLFKGAEPARAWLGGDALLGYVAMGVAWLCLLGGVALLAKALPKRERRTERCVPSRGSTDPLAQPREDVWGNRS